MDDIDPADSKKLDVYVAEYFFGCNIPFAACESKYFKNMMKTLRPAYSPPNRKQMSGQLLDEVHAKIVSQNNRLAGKMECEAALLIDGWSNSSANRHNVVVMLSAADDQKIFLESYDISELRKTGDELVNIIKKAKELAKQMFDIDVYAVVSDNAPNMTSMGNQLEYNVHHVLRTYRKFIGKGCTWYK